MHSVGRRRLLCLKTLARTLHVWHGNTDRNIRFVHWQVLSQDESFYKCTVDVQSGFIVSSKYFLISPFFQMAWAFITLGTCELQNHIMIWYEMILRKKSLPNHWRSFQDHALNSQPDVIFVAFLCKITNDQYPDESYLHINATQMLLELNVQVYDLLPSVVISRLDWMFFLFKLSFATSLRRECQQEYIIKSAIEEWLGAKERTDISAEAVAHRMALWYIYIYR